LIINKYFVTKNARKKIRIVKKDTIYCFASKTPKRIRAGPTRELCKEGIYRYSQLLKKKNLSVM